MAMKSKKPSDTVLACREALLSTLKLYDDKLSGMEILALLSHLIGQVIALQDQKTVTKEMALQLLIANIEAGNAEAMSALMDSKGTA